MQQIKLGERCFQLFQINWVAQAESCVAPLLPVTTARRWHGGGIAYVLGTLPLPSPSAEFQNIPPRHPGIPRSSLVREWKTFGRSFQSTETGWVF